MKKRKVVALTGCMLFYCSFAPIANAQETDAGGNAQKIEEVLVTAPRLQELSPVELTVITADDIKARGAQNVAEALKEVTGVYITSGNAKGMAIAQIRGSNAENTKVFVDGVPLTQVGEAKVDLRNIPAENIAKIEVIKGAASVIYGTDAPGGIIYVTTKKGQGKMNKSVSVAAGDNNNYKLSATVAGDTGKFNYYFGAKQERTDGYTDHTRENAEYYNGKFSWELKNSDSLTVFGSYTKRSEQVPNRFYIDGSILPYPSGGGSVSGSSTTYSGTYDWEFDPVKQTYAGMLYNRKLNKISDLSLKIYHSGESSLLNTMYEPGDKPLHVNWDGKVDGFELQHVTRTSPANTFTWGYAYEKKSFEETCSSAYASWADYDYHSNSVYLQNVTKVGNKLALSMGFRHDAIKDHETTYNQTGAYHDPYAKGYHDDHGDYTANKPVVSLTYALNDNTNLHGAVGKSYRYPNARERCGSKYYISGSGSTAKMVDLPYLLPEEALNREVGLTHTTKFGLGLDFTYFNKDITNMIKSSNNYMSYKDMYFNIPNVNMHGFEVELSQKVGKYIKGFLNYTYTNAFDTQKKRQVADIPFRKLSYGLNYEGKDGINVNLAVSYYGSTKSMFSIGDGNGTADAITNFEGLTLSLPSYHVVDLKVSKQVKNEEFYFKINNLLDEKYYSGAWLLGPGRYVEVCTSVKF
ncbi:Colicin I receptor precursor [Sporomusa ovata DSM 2662]|uniref:TonB-dependent receptor Outer membrane receptor for ferrienterochelin and colicins n=1 Tax=Sporomusa ovata TaxID=2378 RepID=A0A0U1KX96_9FIRM|nr:TonB-dependent receptor [Sporomusa ovata]EQB28734.1 ligand-gated TonB-dependent outer membrane channel [Sporomusa ovata DSM 2662]CQR71885.1 TonB-dependent receptor; Outer membrane receptor for ferrienterochelin and colicins [Sporomusa ovata]